MLDTFKRLLGREPGPEPSGLANTGRRDFDPRFRPARSDRLTADLPGYPTSANEHARRDRRRAVAHSQAMYRAGAILRSAVDSTVIEVVGSGTGFQSKADSDTARAAVEEAWARWSAGLCDVSGQRTLAGIERAVLRSLLVNGEALVVKHRGPEFGAHGFALQLLDPGRVDADMVRELRGGTYIDQGIEFDSFGRPVAYHVLEAPDRATPITTTHKTRRVPAEDVIFLALRAEPEQVRGLPWAAPVLSTLVHLDRYFEAAVVAARTGAAAMGFFESEEGDELDGDIPIEVDPGSMVQLPAGMRFNAFNPTYPAGEFPEFVRACLRTIAAGLGISYQTLAADLSDTSYSSARQGLLDERDTFKAFQDVLVEEFLAPVFNEWLEAALASRAITARGTPFGLAARPTLERVLWTPRRWSWIDPAKEVRAQVEAIKAGLRSPSEVVRESGRDFEEVVAEIAADLAALREAGVDILGGAR